MKKFLIYVSALSLLGSLPVSANDETEETWAVYWYLCGSDLESQYGCATEDLSEMLEVSLPENVTVVVETGGATEWQNETVDPSCLERYVYQDEELSFVDSIPSASMGEASTLADFLDFCSTNYPADHTAVIFWDHGSGSASGVSFDEIYDYDSLTLDEIYNAFASVYELSEENPPLDLVGFDACLMATVDTASMLSDVASYMVASEETEPGNGWYYTGWLGALAEDPSMDGATLGTAICDSFQEGCEIYGTDDEITLSVIDLSQISLLLVAYDNLGKEALSYACADPIFFSEFGRSALQSENYGGNTEDQGYTNMVDLGDLVNNSAALFTDTGSDVLSALEDCVVYKVNGPYREKSSGLSCYYSYSGNTDDFIQYASVGASDAFRYLYSYELSGSLDEDGIAYVSEMGYGELPEIPSLAEDGSGDYPLTLNDEGYAVMELDADTANLLKGVYFQLAYMDVEDDILLYLGRDNDIDMDWENGVFTDNFRGVWGSIDGNLCYMEIVYEGDDYNLYSVPVKLNGEDYHLRVVYDYSAEEFTILGARKGIDDNGMSDRNLIRLQPGDELTTIHYASTISGDDDFTPVEIDTFTVTENTTFEETEMGDGQFLMLFEMVDLKNESVYSDPIIFTVTDGEIEAEL